MKILVIDDEVSILYLIELSLKIEGYTMVKATTATEGIEKLKIEKPDLVILDIMLPDMTGYDAISKLREIDENVPVIMLSAKSDINDKLIGLQLGADDYITKPFYSAELLLRIKAITKRMNKVQKTDSINEISVENLKLIKSERKALLNNKEIILTFKEFDVLRLLCENPKKVFTREDLLDKVWGYNFKGTTRAVDILIQRLRKKLKSYQNIIKTVYGVGYKIEVTKNEY